MSVNPEELEGEEEPQEPVAYTRITYRGPVAPHWDIVHLDGDEGVTDDFRARAMARLQLLPPHDPQFRRNRERVNRDAERELIDLTWDLGYDEDGAGDAASLGDKPTPAAPLVGADDTEVGTDTEADETPAAADASAPPTEDTPTESASAADGDAATSEEGADDSDAGSATDADAEEADDETSDEEGEGDDAT